MQFTASYPSDFRPRRYALRLSRSSIARERTACLMCCRSKRSSEIVLVCGLLDLRTDEAGTSAVRVVSRAERSTKRMACSIFRHSDRSSEMIPVRSMRILAIENAGAAWSEQALRLDFLNRVGKSIMLDEARYRIISEWIPVLDRSTHKPVRAGAFEPPSETEAPQLDAWLTMPKERIVRIAAAFPTPPEVFSKYPELVDQQPTLSHTLMTNFWAFHRWVDQQPRILERLTIAGRAAKVPGGSSLAQMIATEWVCRGESFQQWYGEVVQPLCRS